MESNNKLKEISLKNRTCYHFDSIIKFEDFDIDNILIEEKSSENILIYNISYKTLTGAKSVRVRFDEVGGFIRVYDRTRYLLLCGPKKYDAIFSRTRYLIRVKSGITYVISHNYAKIKVDSYNSLPLVRTLTFHNVIILIKSVFNKNKINYYYNIVFEKALYELPRNNNNK